MAIFATSDMHFGHDREFVWKVRGFNSIQEMNDAYVNRWNSVVGPEDDVYCLGDLMLGDPSNIEYIKKLNGKSILYMVIMILIIDVKCMLNSLMW